MNINTTINNKNIYNYTKGMKGWIDHTGVFATKCVFVFVYGVFLKLHITVQSGRALLLFNSYIYLTLP